CYEKLRRAYTRNRIQVPPNIKAHRPNGSAVPQAHSHSVGVVINELTKTDIAIHISAVVERYKSQTFFNGKRNAQLGVQNKKLVASDRHSNVLDACAGVVRIRANRYRALRPRSVDGKSSQGSSTARKKSFAGRNEAAAIGLRQA